MKTKFMVSVFLSTGLFLYSYSAFAFSWADAWQRSDQQAARALAEGNPRQAATLFKKPEWRAVAQYRAGEYQQAANNFAQEKNVEAAYNRGNALVHLGNYHAAITAYDEALTANPKNADAKFNRDLVMKLLRQQQAMNQPSQNQQQAKNNQQQSSAQDAQNKQQPSPQNSPNNQAQPNQSSPNNSQQPGANQTNPQDQSNSPNNNNNKNPHTPQAKDKLPGQSTERKKMKKPQLINQATVTQREQQQASDQLLQQVPDDPGGLLKQIFLRDYLRRHSGEV